MSSPEKPQHDQLQADVSEAIQEIVDSAIAGNMRDIPRGDVQGMAEAVAYRVIKMVRESES